MNPPLVFSLTSGVALASRICARLGLEPGRHEERAFEDGEHKIRPLQSVRGRDVYVVESLHADPDTAVDTKLCRVLFLVGALRDAGAARVTMVAPYLCYARKDRRTKPRDPVTTRYVAALFEAVGTDRMVTVDVHNLAAYQNAFRIPTEHLSARRMFADWIAARLGDAPVVVVSPDPGGVKRAERFRQTLTRCLGRDVDSAFLEKLRSEGVVRGSAVVGEVSGRIAIVIDDLVAGGTTLARAAAACRDRGATSVVAAATHGVFAESASRLLSEAPLDRLFILDTIPPSRLAPELLRERVVVLDAAPLLAGAIDRMHRDGSLVELTED